jgi:hypothetical protein
MSKPVPATLDLTTLVRHDRVGIWPLFGWRSKLPVWLPPIYGDLWLSQTGQAGFIRVSSGLSYASPYWTGAKRRGGWETSLADMTAQPVGWRAAFRSNPYARIMRRRFIELHVSGQRYILMFTGISHFLSGSEKLIARVPGVHHAGTFLVVTKAMVVNRGSRRRALAARQVWTDVINGAVRPDELPLIVDGQAPQLPPAERKEA